MSCHIIILFLPLDPYPLPPPQNPYPLPYIFSLDPSAYSSPCLNPYPNLFRPSLSPPPSLHINTHIDTHTCTHSHTNTHTDPPTPYWRPRHTHCSSIHSGRNIHIKPCTFRIMYGHDGDTIELWRLVLYHLIRF